MQTFAIMCKVTYETEVYVDAENLLEAYEFLAKGEAVTEASRDNLKCEPLDFIKPQVWSDELQDYIPCNVIRFPVKDEVEFEEE
jgi:hypothetical protein